jgi:hypothetical protein
MPPTPPGNDSAAISSSLFDLDLPVVREGEEPLPLEEPSYEFMPAHARFLLESGLAFPRQPNPEPFMLE